MLKIAFCGIANKNKELLAEEVRKILSLKFNVSISDNVAKNNPYDKSMESWFINHFYLMSNTINEENLKMVNSQIEILICDNSILDKWVNWQIYYKKCDESSLLEKRNLLIKELFNFYVTNYDIIFHIKGNIEEIEKSQDCQDIDKVDIDWLKNLENIYNDVIEKENINVTEIWNNNIDESAYKIIEIITQRMENIKKD